jgi:ComF family protein
MFTILKDLVALVYPDVCMVCGNSLTEREKIICIDCEHHLPRTRFHDDPENPVAVSFWGRVEISSATAFLYFRRGTITQHLLHKLKYKGKKHIGRYLGELFACELVRTEFFQTIDAIIPVPLHPAKKRKRGFNQSELIARGMAKVMEAEVFERVLVRKTFSSTQTRKNRFERWKNVENIFSVEDKKRLEGLHVMVIDDVITTGATMEACLQALSEIDGIALSAGAIAFASK